MQQQNEGHMFGNEFQHSAAISDRDLLAQLLRPVVGASARQTATHLIGSFGSLSGVLAAAQNKSHLVPTADPAVYSLLDAIKSAAERVARDRINPTAPILSSMGDLLDYLHVRLAFERIEKFHVLFLDKKNRLIADEVQQHGTVDHTPVYPREVIKRTLELSSTALILVHNHPSGDPAPSAADVRMTRSILDVAKPLGIIVHDHIIIGMAGHASMRALRLLDTKG
ncbi:DNA repair protein RadC [Devosia sp. H5989]|nr:DNA repair protein RadC [Devosia sp. H5989]